MNAPDYGGGTPVVDVWRRDAGIGVGHLEMAPKLVSLPVTQRGPDLATLAVEFKQNQVLKPGETLKTFRTFAAVHEGDTITFDIPNRKLTLNVPEAEIAKRLAAWKAPEPRFKRGVFAKYANSVSSASEGAVTT